MAGEDAMSEEKAWMSTDMSRTFESDDYVTFFIDVDLYVLSKESS